MSILNEEIKAALNDKSSLKSIATISKDGIPHLVYKGSLHEENDLLVFDELLESSQNTRNLVYSLWYSKKVSIQVLTSEKKSYEIIGSPVKAITCGKLFEKEYEKIQERIPDGELSGIWYIQPEEVDEKTFQVRKAQQDEAFPELWHLDRLAK